MLTHGRSAVPRVPSPAHPMDGTVRSVRVRGTDRHGGLAYHRKHHMPAWRNWQRTRLVIGRLGVRVSPSAPSPQVPGLPRMIIGASGGPYSGKVQQSVIGLGPVTHIRVNSIGERSKGLVRMRLHSYTLAPSRRAPVRRPLARPPRSGSRGPARPHSATATTYCVRAPEFLIEYDNTQDDANHASLRVAAPAPRLGRRPAQGTPRTTPPSQVTNSTSPDTPIHRSPMSSTGTPSQLRQNEPTERTIQ
jgi:hypothetical protein